MTDDVSAADGGGERAERQSHTPSSSETPHAARQDDDRSSDPGKPSQDEAESGSKPFWEQLNIREWITVGATVAAAMAAVASALIAYWTYWELDKQRIAMVGQLTEMQSSSADTKALITAQNTQAKAVQALAEATRDMELDGRKTVAPILTTNNVPAIKGPFTANQVAVFSIFITNDGFASANHYRAWAKAIVGQSPLRKPITTLIPDDMPVAYLAKDQTAQELDAVTETLISQEDFEAIQRGDRAIYIFGEATYVDPYGESGTFPIRFIYGRDPHATGLAVTANDFPVKEVKGD